MKRLCEAMFAFDAGAAIAAYVLAQMSHVPQLFTVAAWFGCAALCFAVYLRVQR